MVFVPGGNRFIRCDPNNDGRVDISDPIWTVNELFLGDRKTTCPIAADCNGSGAVDISDPIYGLSFLFIGGPAPPAPFPECGVAPEDGLLCPSGSTGCP